MDIFDKWDQELNTETFQDELNELIANGGVDFKEAPVGRYECKIDKMHLKKSSNEDPMFFVQFRIVAGEFKKSCLFLNQVITQPFQIYRVTEFLKSLGVADMKFDFHSYAQYNKLIMDLHQRIDANRLEYLVEYTKSNTGFPIYTIKEIYNQ